MPKVNVSIPVYNGGDFLEESLECLRAQTYEDFQVNVFNNASTDDTRIIAERFADRDKRFRVFTGAETVPPLTNFRNSLAHADCDYFAWRAHDDLPAPTFLDHLVRLLDENPRASLAACEVRSYDEAKDRWTAFPAPRIPASRVGAALTLMFRSHASWIYGLFRRERLLQCHGAVLAGLPGRLMATDHATMFPMLISGEVAVTNETYFIQRVMKRPPRDRVINSAERWDFYKAFFQYFQEQADQSDLDALTRAVVKVAIIGYTHRRLYRLTQIFRHKLLGR